MLLSIQDTTMCRSLHPSRCRALKSSLPAQITMPWPRMARAAALLSLTMTSSSLLLLRVSMIFFCCSKETAVSGSVGVAAEAADLLDRRNAVLRRDCLRVEVVDVRS